MNNENFGTPQPSPPRKVWSRHFRDQPYQQALTRHVKSSVGNGALLSQYHGEGGNFGLVVPPGLSNAGQSYNPPRYPEFSLIDFQYLDPQNRLDGVKTYNDTRHDRYSYTDKDGKKRTASTSTLTQYRIPKASPIRSFVFHNLMIINDTGSTFTQLFKEPTTGINIPFEIVQDITTRTYDPNLDEHGNEIGYVESTQTYTIFSGIAPSNTTGTETVDALGANGSEHDLEVNTNSGNSKVYLVLRIDLMTSEDKSKLQKYFDLGKNIRRNNSFSSLRPLSITYSGLHIYKKIVSYQKIGRSRATYNGKKIPVSYDDPSEFSNRKQEFVVNISSNHYGSVTDSVSVTRNPAKRPENFGSGSSSGSGSKAPIEVKIKTTTSVENGYVAVYRVHNLNKDVFIHSNIFDHSLSGVTPSNSKEVINKNVSSSERSIDWDVFSSKWKNRSPFSLASQSSMGFPQENDFQFSKAGMFVIPNKGVHAFNSFESLGGSENFNSIILTPTVTFGEATDLKNESSFTDPNHDQKHGAPILYEIRPAKLKVTGTKTNGGSDGQSFETVTSTSFENFLPGEYVHVWVEPELPPQCPVVLNFNGQRDPRKVEEAISKRKENPRLADLTTVTVGFDAEFYKRYNSRGQQVEQVVEVFLPRSNTLKDLKLAGLANCPDGADPLTIKYDITIKVYDHNSNFLYETTDTVTQDDNDIKHFSANGIQNIEDTHTYTSSTNGTLKPVMALEKKSHGDYFNPRRCRFRGQYDGMLNNKFTIPNEHVVVDKNADDDPSVSLTNGKVEVSVSIAYNSGRGGNRDLGMQKIGGSKGGKRIQHFQSQSSSTSSDDYRHANSSTLLNYSPVPAPKTFIVASSTGSSVTLTWTEESSLIKRKMEFVDQYRLRVFEYPVFNNGFKTVTSGNFIINPRSNRKVEEKIIDYDVNDTTKSITLPINSSKGYEFRLEKRSALGTKWRLNSKYASKVSVTHEEYSVPFIIQHIPAGAGGTGIRPPTGVTNSSPDINNNITDFYIWDASFRGGLWKQGTLNRSLEYGSTARQGTVQKIKNLEGGVMHVAVNCFADDLKLVLQRSTDNGATWNGLTEFTRFSYEPMPKRVQKPSGFTYSDAQPVSIFQIPHLVGNFNGVPVNIFTDSNLPSGTKFRFQLYSAKLSAAYGTGDGSTPIKLKGSGGSEYTGGWQAYAVTYSPRLANLYPVRKAFTDRRDIPSDPTLRENIGITMNWDGEAIGQKIDEYTYLYDAGSTNLNIGTSRRDGTRYAAGASFDIEFSGNHPDTQLAAMAVNVNSAKNPIGLPSSAQQLRWSTGVHSPVIFSPTGKMASDTAYGATFALETPTELFINNQFIDKSAYHFDNIVTNVTFYNTKNGTFRKRYARISIGISDELAQALYDLGRISGTNGFKISDTRLHSRGNPKNKIFSDEDYNTIKSLFSNYGILVRAVTNGDPSSNDMASVGTSTYRTNFYNIFQHLLEKK